MANRLIDEQSPYLLQHAHNPVDWWPWGEAAFEQARLEQKPLLVSIGYSACHWCHVMEHESFEDEETAAFMNSHFINIKVDREEYPDVDDFYMTAVQSISGSGGWPLNVFVTPEKLPFYGGTYFPPLPAYGRPSWIQLLQRMADIWDQRRDEVYQQSDQMLAHLKNAAQVTASSAHVPWSASDIQNSVSNLLKQADTTNGGFGRAPKFPSTMAIGFLLEYAHFTGSKEAMHHALFSLDAMIAGGIYDQIGGGFSRYAVDDKWLVPHFEKMLYDNALLVSVLCDAYHLSGKEVYRSVVEQTIAFLLREMKQEEGGFYSALDADSEGEEGKFYTWKSADWQAATGGQNALASRYFGVTEEGNWEHTNILHRAVSMDEICRENKLDYNTAREQIESVQKRLLALREKRVRPGTDDKILLSWNALTNIALCKAANVLGDEEYARLAIRHMDWMLEQFETATAPKHTWKNGKAKIHANLDDIAYLVRSLILLSMTVNEERFLREAVALTRFAEHHFGCRENSLFYFSSDLQQEVPLRKPELYDGVTPSSNAVMAECLYLLGMLTENSNWIARGGDMIKSMRGTAVRYPASFAFWNTIAQRMTKKYKTIIVTGESIDNVQNDLKKKFLPECFYFFEKKENFVTMPFGKQFEKKTQIFICTENSCLPVMDRLPENTDFAIL